MRIKNWVIEKIRSSGPLKRALMDYYECSERTVYRMLEMNNKSLLQIPVVNLVSSYLKVEPSDLIEKTDENGKAVINGNIEKVVGH